MTKDLVEAKVSRLPLCDFCNEKKLKVDAQYDFKTKFGPWAFGCEAHWKEYRHYEELGLGKGQKLVVKK